MDDPEEEDENGEDLDLDVDVAASMGFGSFGDQHREKRRRYDGRAEDAVVDGAPSPSGTGRGKGKRDEGVHGSGSNTLPLGTPGAHRGGGGGVNVDEGSERGGNGTHSARKKTGKERRFDAVKEGDADSFPAETSKRAAASPEAQQNTPAFSPAPSHPSLPLQPPPAQPLPSRPGGMAPAPAPRTDEGAWKLRKGVVVANGDVAYYDAGFVEDPWRGLGVR